MGNCGLFQSIDGFHCILRRQRVTKGMLLQHDMARFQAEVDKRAKATEEK